jgi:ribosomal protein S18 acetylase RimI-like enzyme
VPQIRPAGPDDLDAVLAILDHLYDEPTRPDPAKARATWDEILSQPGRIILLAEVDGTLAGTADMIIVPNLTRAARPWVSVENVVVAPTHRRQGIGRALFAEISTRATNAGAYKIQLMSAANRDPAHDFYETLGFEKSAQAFKKYL